MTDPRPAVPLPFSITVEIVVRPTDRRHKTRAYHARVTNLVYEPSLWPDDPFTPAFVFGEWSPPGAERPIEVACVVLGSFPVEEITADSLEAREWSPRARFDDPELDIGHGYRQGLTVAQRLRSNDLPASRSIVRDIQQRRQAAVKQYDEAWLNGELAHLRLAAGNPRPLTTSEVAHALKDVVDALTDLQELSKALADTAVRTAGAYQGDDDDDAKQAAWLGALSATMRDEITSLNKRLSRFRGHAETVIQLSTKQPEPDEPAN